MFSEGHKQLPSLVKAGMSHMAPLHALIRRVLQLRVGLVAIKELSLLLSKPPFSRTSTSRGTKKLHITTSRSDRSRQAFSLSLSLCKGRWLLNCGVGVFLYRLGLVGSQQDKH